MSHTLFQAPQVCSGGINYSPTSSPDPEPSLLCDVLDGSPLHPNDVQYTQGLTWANLQALESLCSLPSLPR